MRTSVNGWSVVEAGKTPETTPSGQPRIRQFLLPGNIGLKVWMRDGVAGFLLADLLTTFNRRIEPLRGPTPDDWGYALREIRGAVADDFSNHASGTAVDANALKHPHHSLNTFSRRQQFMIRFMLKHRYKGLIEWGGDWRPENRDDMHFEIVGTHNDVRHRALALMQTRRGKRILMANPGLLAVIRG